MSGVQYRTVVSWDPNIIDVSFTGSAASVPSALRQLAISGIYIVTGAPVATPDVYLVGAEVINAVDGETYKNIGTTPLPVWATLDHTP